MDPKEYEKYARMYGITDYRGLLQAIEQLKREKAEESGRPVNSFNIKLYSIEFNGLLFFSEHNFNTEFHCFFKDIMVIL